MELQGVSCVVENSSSSEYDSSSDTEVDMTTLAGIKPYQFEPKYSESETRDNSLTADAADDSMSSDSDVDIAMGRLESTEWCSCTNCLSMPTLPECVCCGEMSGLEEKLDEIGNGCITDHTDFEAVCNYQAVLMSVLVRLHDIRRDPLTEPIPNRAYRWAAYTQFTYWVHTRLGRNVRRVIPSCVVLAIRKAYPEEDGMCIQGLKTPAFHHENYIYLSFSCHKVICNK